MLTKGFFQLAKSASKNSTYHIRVGCVIVLHGKPVSVGWNIEKSHPRYTTGKHKTIHAEIKAILSAQCDLTNGVAYVYRETRDGMPALAKPCEVCEAVLQEVGIKTVFYTVGYEPHYKRMRL